MQSTWQPRKMILSFLQISALLGRLASAKDLDGGELDNAGSHRITYHLAFLGAQDGQEQALIHNPDFEKRCNEDRECHLALKGMPASVAKKSLATAVLPCPDEECDTGDLVEVYSQMYARSAQDSFIRTSLLSRFHGTDGNASPEWSENDLNVIAELDKWLTWDSPDESKLKRHRNHWVVKLAEKWFRGSPAARNTTASVRGSVFLESVFGGSACAGDSFLCPVGSDQVEIVKPVLAVLWGMSTDDKGERVLHKNNPLRHSIDRLKTPADAHSKRNSSSRALQQMAKGAKNKGSKRKEAKHTAEAFLKEAQLNAEAAKDLVFESMKYTTEVFDPHQARIWHANLRLDRSRVLDSGLAALGYAPLIPMDDTGFPMLGHEQTRIASDLMPVTGGDWLTLTLDNAGALNATSTLAERSIERSMSAPRDPHWHVPAEGVLAHSHRSLSRRDASASSYGFLPDFRVFQILVTENGGVLTNSMGLPMIRAVDAIDGQLATNPVIQSVDATPLEGGTFSVMALRVNGAKGNPIQLGDPLQFRLDRRSVGGNKIARSKSHAQFPDRTSRLLAFDAISPGPASRFQNRKEAEVFQPWLFEEIQDLQRVVATNHRELEWIQQGLNATDSPTVIGRLNKLQSAIKDTTASSKDQISKLQEFARGIDKDFTEELWLGDTPHALRQLLVSERDVARHAEIARAKRSEFFILENFGEGVAFKQLTDLISALEANDDRGFQVKELMEIRALELFFYRGLGTETGSKCQVQKPEAKSGKAIKVRRGDGLEGHVGHDLVTIAEDEVLTAFSMEAVVQGYVDPATLPVEQRAVFPKSNGILRHSGASISSAGSRGTKQVSFAPEIQEAFYSPASSVESLASDSDAIITGKASSTVASSKVPLTAVGWVATGILIGLQISAEVLALTLPDISCPRPKYRTEMWNAEAAAQTTIRSPCTHTETGIWFPTATALETMTVAFGLPEATGGFDFSLDSTRKRDSRQSSWNSTSSWSSINVKRSVARNGTAAVAAADSPALPDTSTGFTISQCPTKTLPDNRFVWVLVKALPCPVPTPVECGVGWFREHINDLPVGIRSPNYCSNGDLVGYACAVDRGCFPDYASKECKRDFGLDKKERENLLEELQTKADLAQDELDAQIEAHWEEEEKSS